MKSTQAMRDRIRELMGREQDDYDRAVECVLDDLEAALRSTVPSPHAGVGEREALAQEISRWENDERTLYPDNEILASLERICAAPAVVGMDARTIEECAKICDRWIASKNLHEHLAATDIARDIRALAVTRPERGAPTASAPADSAPSRRLPE